MHEELAKRIEGGRDAVSGQISFFNQHFGQVVSEWKSDATRVTAVDRAISENILAKLKTAFPDDDLFSEEMATEGGPVPRKGEYSWILDPVDGTNNYALGIPFCAISLGLLREGQPVYGFIYDFARGRIIEGGVGVGVKDGDRFARVLTSPPTRESIVGMHSPQESAEAPRASRLVEQFKVRAMGSSALHLAYVAIGLFDGAVDLNVRIWDIAAAQALCIGSGAKVKHLKEPVFPLQTFDLSAPRIHICAGNPSMCACLENLLKA